MPKPPFLLINTKVKGIEPWQYILTIFIENFALDVLGILGPPLITSCLLMSSMNLGFCRLFKYKILSLENSQKVHTNRENLNIYTRNLMYMYEMHISNEIIKFNNILSVLILTRILGKYVLKRFL